jgi:hypothetical protein
MDAKLRRRHQPCGTVKNWIVMLEEGKADSIGSVPEPGRTIRRGREDLRSVGRILNMPDSRVVL